MTDETVSVEIDKFIADTLIDLARNGALGIGLKKADLDGIVNFLLSKSIRSGQRKLNKKNAAKEEAEREKEREKEVLEGYESLKIAFQAAGKKSKQPKPRRTKDE